MKFTNEILGSTKLFALLVLGSIPGILCFASVRFVNMVGMGLNLTPTNNFFTRTSLLIGSVSAKKLYGDKMSLAMLLGQL